MSRVFHITQIVTDELCHDFVVVQSTDDNAAHGTEICRTETLFGAKIRVNRAASASDTCIVTMLDGKRTYFAIPAESLITLEPEVQRV